MEGSSALLAQPSGVAADNSPIPVDGTPNLTYEATDNRINTSGYLYDKAGNQIKAKAPDGSWLRYEYDAANRIQAVKRDSDGATLQAFQYGSTNARLMDMDYGFGYLKIFASIGGQTLAEYTEYYGAIPSWTKSYNYLGDSVLSTVTPNGTGGETTEFNHPDGLGTRVITNQAEGTSSEQTTLPFGTALNAESTVSLTKRFTSYERSNQTGLDYAINRTYDSKQGRFTQVDPIGMSASSLLSPQTLNLYTYCGNDPINHTDPSGLFFGSFFKWLGKKLGNFIKKVIHAAVKAAITALITFVTSGFNVKAAVVAFIGAFIANLGFPKMGNVLTPGWNPNIRHPLSGNSGFDRYIIQNLTAVATNFLCPPSAQKIISAFSNTFRNLLRNQSGHRTNNQLENGGWIYQKEDGSLFFKQAERWRRKIDTINLSNPPTIRGARVVADIHTHPYPAKVQNDSIRFEESGLGLGTGPSLDDSIISKRNGYPGIVVYEGYAFDPLRHYKGDLSSAFYSAWVGPNQLSQGNCK